MSSSQHYIQMEGPLFEAVQTSELFSDCKTFVDCTPLDDPKIIEQEFLQKREQADFDLKAFINKHFALPEAVEIDIDKNANMEQRIANLWYKLAQDPDQIKSPHATLVPLPHPYIVPGGRFREIYYWDSYFTSEGLACSGHIDMVVNMAKNFAFLIEHLGLIPTANRVYYQSRSQPPYFCFILDILEKYQGKEFIAEFIPALEQEYLFWMDGAENLTTKNNTHRRVVRLSEGAILNRYWDDDPKARPESYREDIELYKATNSEYKENLYRNIRASCESGWDFSSRWCRNPLELTTLRTTELIPVDLNALLFHLEEKLANYFDGIDNIKSQFYQELATQRKMDINHYCWDEQAKFYKDYCWTAQQPSAAKTLAATTPLFVGLANDKQAKAVAETIEQAFLFAGGLTTTLVETNQQWDKPNGWAPLHWITIQGLTRYGFNDLAKEIATRWVTLNHEVFKRTGKMKEKYNVVDTSLFAGGGEYTLQDGFGWTNAVAIALIKQFDLKL